MLLIVIDEEKKKTMKPRVYAAAAAPSNLGLALRSLSEVPRGRVSVRGRENLQLPLLSQRLLFPGCVFCVILCVRVRVCVRVRALVVLDALCCSRAVGALWGSGAGGLIMRIPRNSLL